MTTFKKGDRVRYTGKEYRGAVPIGTLGTVRDLQTSTNCYVDWDDGTERAGVLPTNLELVVETPRAFVVGDRVRYTGNDPQGYHRDSIKVGKVGTVISAAFPMQIGVNWDDGCIKGGSSYSTNLELIAADTPLVVGDRVVVGACTIEKYAGQAGVLRNLPAYDGDLAIVELDSDQRRRCFNFTNLRREETTTMPNFKTTVAAAVTALFATKQSNPKDQAVQRLGIAAELVRLGEADKKKAKTELTALGVIGDKLPQGSQLVYDSASFTITAETKAASSRLDQGKLVTAMTNEGISFAKMQRIIAAATVENAAATSYKVEAK